MTPLCRWTTLTGLLLVLAIAIGQTGSAFQVHAAPPAGA